MGISVHKEGGVTVVTQYEQRPYDRGLETGLRRGRRRGFILGVVMTGIAVLIMWLAWGQS